MQTYYYQDSLTLKVLLAAKEYFDQFKTAANDGKFWTQNDFDNLKVGISMRHGVALDLLGWAIGDIRCKIAHPSEAFVNARDVAQRIKGRGLNNMELAGIVQTIEEQEAMDQWQIKG